MMMRLGYGRTLSLQRLNLSSVSRYYHEVSFSRTGDPKDVLEYHEASTDDTDPPLKDDDASTSVVRVELQAAPWNPADVNTVQGKYPSPYTNKNTSRDALRYSRYWEGRTVAGSEGMGRITHIIIAGANKNGNHHHHVPLQVGDWVTVGQPGLGTMRSSLWVPPTAVIPIEQGQDLYLHEGYHAAALFQLGGTALRMLRDFVHLQEGDIILQNAGNSGVGYMASQLAVALFPNVHFVSLVRRGSRSPEQFDKMVEHLTTVGKNATVVAEEDLHDRDSIKSLESKLREISDRPPVLALNSVGGKSASILLKLLGRGGTHVTYGGMSKEPVTVAIPQLIFKDVRVRGYWHSAWMVQHSLEERKDMMDELVTAVLRKQVECPPVQVFPLADFQKGLECDGKQSSQAIRSKVVFHPTN